MLEVAGLITLGLIAGSIAAALGIGGGVIYVPVLVVLFSFDQHMAQGTSLAIILPTAVVATVAHTRLGNVRWRLAIPVAVAGIAGAVTVEVRAVIGRVVGTTGAVVAGVGIDVATDVGI